jgi:hypothetical protein
MDEKYIDIMMRLASRDLEIEDLKKKVLEKTKLSRHWRAKYLSIPSCIRNIVEYLNKIKWTQETNR